QRLFPLWRITRSSDEAEGQHTLGTHVADRGEDEVLVNVRGLHIAQIAQQRQRSQLVLAQEALPALALLGSARELDLPRLGRSERAGDELLPPLLLHSVLRTSVREEEHVAQLHPALAIVLRERVRVELCERRSEPLLHLRGERLLAI